MLHTLINWLNIGTTWSKTGFHNLIFVEEPLKQFFLFRGTPTYENAYKQQTVDGGKRNSVAALSPPEKQLRKNNTATRKKIQLNI